MNTSEFSSFQQLQQKGCLQLSLLLTMAVVVVVAVVATLIEKLIEQPINNMTATQSRAAYLNEG